MKAMILAAGKGTRVRPLTNLLPKPMGGAREREASHPVHPELRDAPSAAAGAPA